MKRASKSPARQTADKRAWKIFRLRGAYALFRNLRGQALPGTSEWKQTDIICAAVNDMLHQMGAKQVEDPNANKR